MRTRVWNTWANPNSSLWKWIHTSNYAYRGFTETSGYIWRWKGDHESYREWLLLIQQLHAAEAPCKNCKAAESESRDSVSDVYLPFSSQEQVRCEAGQSQGSWRVIYSWFRNVLFSATTWRGILFCGKHPYFYIFWYITYVRTARVKFSFLSTAHKFFVEKTEAEGRNNNFPGQEPSSV